MTWAVDGLSLATELKIRFRTLLTASLTSILKDSKVLRSTLTPSIATKQDGNNLLNSNSRGCTCIFRLYLKEKKENFDGNGQQIELTAILKLHDKQKPLYKNTTFQPIGKLSRMRISLGIFCDQKWRLCLEGDFVFLYLFIAAFSLIAICYNASGSEQEQFKLTVKHYT